MREHEVVVAREGLDLPGVLAVPEQRSGLVVFAHGSGSSRFSPRNRRVAAALVRSGFATLLFDLLTEQEERVDARTSELRFDIPLLSRRLMAATAWADEQLDLAGRALPDVRAATLLIVGGADPVVLDLNRAALAQLRAEKRLEVVPDATHLFEEPGALSTVVQLATGWFIHHLADQPSGK